MATNLSIPNALKAFFDKLGRGKTADTRTVKAVACAVFNVAENSLEADLLISGQIENLRRLISQINLSSIEADAKKTYRKRVEKLSEALRHPALFSRYDAARKDIIDPNYDVLTFLNDALKVSVFADDALAEEIEGLVSILESALNEMRDSTLPLKLKGVLDVQIVQLIFVLKNYHVWGFDKAWEIASTAFLTVQRDIEFVADDKGKGVFKKIAVSIAAVVGVLAAVDAGTGHIANVAARLKSGYEMIEQWRREQTPKIEYHKKDEVDSSFE